MTLRARLLEGDGVGELLDDGRWSALLQAQRRPDPLRGESWLRAQLRHADGLPLAVAVEGPGGELAAAGLFEIRPRVAGAVAGAYWLGERRQRFALDLLVAPGRPEAGALLVAALLRRADLLSLATWRDGELARAVRAVAPWAEVTPGGGTWLAGLGGGVPAGLERAAAQELRRAGRGGAEVTAVALRDPAAVAVALDGLAMLHRERWAGRQDECACFSGSAADVAFHRDAVRAAAACGGASIVEVREDGCLVAASLSVLRPPWAVAYVKAMRPAAALRSPGQVLAHAVARDLCQAGVRAVDLGGGALVPGSPKARLAPVWEPCIQVIALATPRRQRAASGLRAAHRALRRRPRGSGRTREPAG